MDGLALRSRSGAGLLAGTALGSGLAVLDTTVVNVALPHIGTGLHAPLAGLQWTVTAYTLMLAAFVLLGGSLGDRWGRKRVFGLGTAWFVAASVLCGLSGGIWWLVAARALQGLGAALLVPSSLALLNATLRPADRARAIGAWAGSTGMAAALGPPLGGWLIDALSWRWVFFLNLPLGLAALLVTGRYVPDSRGPHAAPGFDVAGALLGAAGLAGVTYALVGGSLLAGAGGLVGLVAFVVVERRSARPMVPPALFASREFTVINAVTLLVYAALGGVLFFFVLHLQVTAGYPALAAGAANTPITLLLLAGSPLTGALSRRSGPRLPMTAGCLLAALGAVALRHVGPHAVYWRDVLPPVTLYGLGMMCIVAPLTAGVLAAADVRHAGVASGVNNAVARAGSLLAVASLPALVGLVAYADPVAVDRAYRTALWYCAGLMLAGALLSATLPRRGAPVPLRRDQP